MGKQKLGTIQIYGKVIKQLFSTTPFGSLCCILFQFFWGLWPLVATLLLSKVFNVANTFLDTGRTGVILEANTRSLWWVVMLFIAGFAVIHLLQRFTMFFVNTSFFEKNTYMAKLRLVQKSERIPLITFEHPAMKDCYQRAYECASYEDIMLVFHFSFFLLAQAINIIGIASILSVKSPWFILIVAMSVLPYLITLLISNKKIYKLKTQQTEARRTRSYLFSLFQEVNSVREMRVMGFSSYLEKKWESTNNQLIDDMYNLEKTNSRYLLFSEAIVGIGFIVGVCLAVFLVLQGSIDIAVLGVTVLALRGCQWSMKGLVSTGGSIARSLPYVSDYYTYLNIPELDQGGECEFTGLSKGVDVRNLSFSYPDSKKPALQNISMHISKGERVALVGVNGSGKTTLVKSILGLYTPNRGEVYYDDIPIDNYSRQDILSKSSLVSQDFGRYNVSIKENICFSEHIDEELLNQTLNQTQCNYLNLEAAVGREFGGIELSKGEWQRVAIARALYRNADFLVLDEPTASLDPSSETEVLQEFIRITTGKTAIIVSHRIGICIYTDKIAVLKEGKLVEFGTHRELYNREGEYYRLFESQKQWYE